MNKNVKPKEITRKEIIKVKTVINHAENGKHQINNDFSFEKKNQQLYIYIYIDPLANLIKREGESPR